MAKKKKGKKRRLSARDRAALRLANDKARLAALEPGGSAERPLEVPSASVVELRARDLGCVQCDGIPHVDSQKILRVDERLLRAVLMTCPRCGTRRAVWVRVVGRTLN